MRRIIYILAPLVFCSAVLAAPPAPPPPPPPPVAAPSPAPATALSAQAVLGRQIFADSALSTSGSQSCASCHAAKNAFSAPNGAPVPLGGISLNLQGLRNAPTIMYASYTPPFVLNAPAPNPGQPPNTAGGFMHDGRIATLAKQAQQPFITAFEMGNSSSAQVLQKLKNRPYLSQFTAVFGAAILNNADATLAAMGQAIAAFETEDPSFHPFSSKFDAVVNRQATLTAQEAAGQAAFNAPNRGNCASCHTSAPRGNEPAALFTNFSYHAVGAPRNWKIVFNLDSTVLPSYVPTNGTGLGSPSHHYYDMGLCGPLRTDLTNNTALCGEFKVPTLRNVAVKQAYFHSGVFGKLNDVVSFYATRNSNPAHWYTKADGTPDILYNDLPVAYDRNIAPINNPGRPLAPNLSAADVQNVVAFLCTLTDGYDPKNPSAYKLPAQCPN